MCCVAATITTTRNGFFFDRVPVRHVAVDPVRRLPADRPGTIAEAAAVVHDRNQNLEVTVAMRFVMAAAVPVGLERHRRPNNLPRHNLNLNNSLILILILVSFMSGNFRHGKGRPDGCIESIYLI